MLDRRKFTFGALLVAAGAPAVARAEDGTGVVARLEATQSADVVLVRLVLANTGPAAVSMMAKSGSRPGPVVRVHRVGAPDGEDLAEIVAVSRQEMVSRIAPRPTYAVLAAAGTAAAELEVGTYRYSAPEGPVDQVDVRVEVFVAPDGEPLPSRSVLLPVQRVRVVRVAA